MTPFPNEHERAAEARGELLMTRLGPDFPNVWTMSGGQWLRFSCADRAAARYNARMIREGGGLAFVSPRWERAA